MTGLQGLSPRKQRRLHRNWRDMHNTKRVFRTRTAARRATVRLLLDNLRDRSFRRRDLSLCTYQCRWGGNWENGASYPPHWHIGHGHGHLRHAWRAVVRRHLLWRYILIPLRRAAHRVRYAARTRSLARHPGWHKSVSR